MTPDPGSAQLTRADSAAVLVSAASEFEAEGRPEVARDLYRFVIRRFPASPAALTAAARMEILNGFPEGSRLNERAATGFRVWSTFYGLGLGVAVPASFGADGSEAYGIGLLVGGPLGFLLGKNYTDSRQLTEGQTQAFTWGSLWGAYQGLGWSNVTNGSDEAMVASATLGSLSGVALGRILTSNGARDGTVTAATMGSIWGTWLGLAASVLASESANPSLAATLVGGNLGLAGGGLLGQHFSWSRKRSLLISLSGAIGGFGGIGLVLVGKPSSDRAAFGVPLVGSVLGLVVGTLLTNDPEEVLAENELASPLGTEALLTRTGEGWALGIPIPSPNRSLAIEAGRGKPDQAWSFPLLKMRLR